ncbi:hypothetical protein B0J12DRAFT_697810 [Macrophomina phaseolina]|uniref:Uncharacterized protein n=1 Tax=Macrophomina phaseolina TaxID=35725 RepID=A0ABQ8GKI1_9PEZI|nr:hypothetical protein B0J12DRAFT_697810 [Macrophomina phaseolina]
MNAAIAMEGIPSIDEILVSSHAEESAPTATTTSTSSAVYETVATIQVPPIPLRAAPAQATKQPHSSHSRYYSISGASNASSTHLPAIANPVDNEAGTLAAGGTEPPRRRSRSRSLFSFRTSSSTRSSANSGSPRSSLDYGSFNDEADDEDAMVRAARKGGKEGSRSGSGSGAGVNPFKRNRNRSRANSVHAAAVLPAVLVLGAECFTPGHGERK